MITIQNIQSIVSKVTGYSVEQIKSPTRKEEIVEARHLSMYFSRFETRTKLLDIAKQHGRDNHATVIHATAVITKAIRTNKRIKSVFGTIQKEIENFS